MTIKDDHATETLTINNEANEAAKAAGKIAQGTKADLVLTINNGSEKAAAKWSGEIAGGAGTLKINNAHANSEWTGKVVAGNGTTEIKNDGVYKGVVETGTNGDSTGNTTITNNKTWGSSGDDAKITHKGKGNLTINNNQGGTIASKILGDTTGTGTIKIVNNGEIASTAEITADDKTGQLSIENGVSSTGAANPQADIKSTITAKANGAIITNRAIISGAITGGSGEGDKGTTITNFSGSITGGIKAGTGDLTIENYAEISGNSKKIETVSGTKKLTINNYAGDIKAEIDAATAVATSVNITNYAGATISGAVKLKSEDQKSATLDNRGKITGAVTATGENVSISNAGIINSTVTVAGTAKKNKHT